MELAADCARTRAGAGEMVPAPREGLASAEASRTMSSEEYRAAIAVAKEHITAGDIFQVVLSQRFDLELEADPFDVYRALRLLNPSPYLYFLRFPEVTVVGASPEPMVRLRDGIVTSRPIAGSRPRGENEHHDRLLEGELAEDPKELAEHIMLVDLARNDVGRVVRFGTEKVDELMTIERYSHIMHITSQVSGELAEDKGPIDVLRATLPAGTLSGAPKVRAMQIIDELERTKRGVYGGRGRLHRLLGQHRHRHRHPHHGGLARRAGPRAGRGGHRGRQRPGARGRGVRPEGAGAAGGGDGGPGHDGRPPDDGGGGLSGGRGLDGGGGSAAADQ